jgi:catechol 2,3-dioxygenase-like lactoylglutathione lyase family enzyme
MAGANLMRMRCLFVCLSAPLALRAQGAMAATEPPVIAVSGATFALSVADLVASERWYTEKLGLEVSMRVPGTVVVLQGGGLSVELIHSDGAVPLRSVIPSARDATAVFGIFKVGVIVADFDGTLATLRARGVEIAYVIVRDNAGNLIQVFGR